MPGNVRPVTDERDGLLSFLAQQRLVVRLAAYGLSDEQAREAPSVSALTLGGLIKHVATMERTWMDTVRRRPRAATAGEDYAAGFRLGSDQTLDQILADYARAAAATDALVAEIGDLDYPVPVPRGVPWFPADVDAWSLRWVLLHLIQETARHAGHADIVRESLDGATAFPLMAAAEGWPETPWMKPWRADVSAGPSAADPD